MNKTTNENGDVKIIEIDLEDNKWYAYKFGRSTWLIKRLNTLLFGFKIDERCYSKREQKEFVKFATERYLQPIILFNYFVADEIFAKKINIIIDYKKNEK